MSKLYFASVDSIKKIIDSLQRKNYNQSLTTVINNYCRFISFLLLS